MNRIHIERRRECKIFGKSFAQLVPPEHVLYNDRSSAALVIFSRYAEMWSNEWEFDVFRIKKPRRGERPGKLQGGSRWDSRSRTVEIPIIMYDNGKRNRTSDCHVMRWFPALKINCSKRIEWTCSEERFTNTPLSQAYLQYFQNLQNFRSHAKIRAHSQLKGAIPTITAVKIPPVYGKMWYFYKQVFYLEIAEANWLWPYFQNVHNKYRACTYFWYVAAQIFIKNMTEVLIYAE